MDPIGSHGPLRQPLDSRQLFAFVALARTGSFTAAGQELSLSPSAVSHSLKAFEGELGQMLFLRVGKKVRLTSAGEHLLHYAERILADMDKARRAMETLAQYGRGRLRIGAAAGICQYFLPGVLAAFQREFPDCPVRVVAADTRECLEAIREQRIDLAVCVAPNQTEPVETHPLFTDELQWLVPPLHAWAVSQRVPTDDIPRQRLIFGSAGHHAFGMVRSYYERDGLHLHPALELDNYEAAKELVRAGQGITAMPAWMAAKELAEGTLVALPLGKRELRRNWCILRSPEAKADFAEMGFVKFSHQAARQLGVAPQPDRRPLGMAVALSAVVLHPVANALGFPLAS